MKAVIKQCYSPHTDDLFGFIPEDPLVFGFPLIFLVGTANEEFSESFEVFLCSPGFLATAYPQNVLFGRHYLIVRHYDFDEILDVVAKHIRSFDEPTWPKLAEKLSRFAKYEFEDYQPYREPRS